jgi:hypothetical protein
VKLALLGLIACCAVVFAAAHGDGGKRARQPQGAPTSGARAPGPVHPRRPSRYRVPRGAIHVSTATELNSALTHRSRSAIVLANGTYSNRRPFLNPFGHQLYAARLGRAVLRAGVSLGGNEGDGGGLVRGVVVDVSDRRRTVGGAAIAVWGTGRNSRILDTRVRGHATLRAGVEAREPQGLVIERLVARRFQDYGVLVDANEPGRRASRPGFRIADIDVARVSRPTPGSSDGRAEACVWIGDAGSVRRVRARSCAWSGLWTGTSTDGSRFEGIDVDRARTGVYLEHFTHDSVFRRLRIGSGVRVGLTAEWADPAWDRKPASVGNVIEDSRFASSLAGVYLDEGTTRTTVRRSTFVGQEWGGIGDYLGRRNRLYANDFRGLGTRAEAVRHDHLSSIRER